MDPQEDLDFLAEASPRGVPSSPSATPEQSARGSVLLSSPSSLELPKLGRRITPQYSSGIDRQYSPSSQRSTSPTTTPPPPPPGDACDLHGFLESTVRTMNYRGFIRWYHGSFNTNQGVFRLIVYYLTAICALWIVYLVLCPISEALPAQSTLQSFAGGTSHLERLRLVARLHPWLVTDFALTGVVVLVFILTAQTPRIAPVSVLGSQLLLVLTCAQLLASGIQIFIRKEAQTCPATLNQIPFVVIFTTITLFQAVLAALAVMVSWFAIPCARLYILRSKSAMAHWGVSVINYKRGIITLRACPFDCSGANHTKRRALSRTWHFLINGKSASFSPAGYYLKQFPQFSGPTPTYQYGEPCCAFCAIYYGQVDDRYRPHGMGVWNQGWGKLFGEYLNGYWEFGRPVAPFMSRQNTCGSGFTALRFGWVRFDFVTPTSIAQVYKGDMRRSSLPEYLAENNFEFGLLDVECSVFGKFFRKFPKFVYWKAPLQEVNVKGRSGSSARPSLGLNNRMSSFSYLDLEVKSRRLSRRRTGFGFGPPRASLTAARALQLLRSISVDEGSEDVDPVVDTPEGVGVSSSTNMLCLFGVKWIIDRMLPHHIPLNDRSRDPSDVLRVFLDPRKGLTPQGWGRVDVTEKWRPPRTLRTLENPQMPTTQLVVNIVENRARARQQGDFVSWSFVPGRSKEPDTPDNEDAEGLGFFSQPEEIPSCYSDPDSTVQYEIGVDNWIRPAHTSSLEALVFIHGYKTPLNEAPLLLGQLIALGGFPNYIKPFMYLWPAGTQVWHYYQARRASHHYLCQKGLVLFLKCLAAKGIQTIHLLAHSMGARLFMNSIKYALRENVFVLRDKGGEQTGLLNLVNLVFLHPEYYLEDFINGGYDQVRQLAGKITIYTHAYDEALASAELLSRGQRCMGKHPFGYVRPLDGPRQTLKGLPFEWLDVDVIDCTYLDANVHALRHCFFNINSNVVGDIRYERTRWKICLPGSC